MLDSPGVADRHGTCGESFGLRATDLRLLGKVGVAPVLVQIHLTFCSPRSIHVLVPVARNFSLLVHERGCVHG